MSGCQYRLGHICHHPVIGAGAMFVEDSDCTKCVAFNQDTNSAIESILAYRETTKTIIPATPRPQCNYLGSKRKCCDDLYICRQQPNTNCTLKGFANPEVRSCQTCQHWMPQPDSFNGGPVVHFGAHVWPRQGRWEWHAKQWNAIAEQINGKCLVGVAVDDDSGTADDVRSLLSDRFEVFEFANTSEGENHTFRELQSRVPQGQDDVLIYAHAKGVKDDTHQSEAIRLWTEMMYETVSRNHARAVRKLAEGYKVFGSFRTFDTLPLSVRNQWHYSGTFCIVRAKHLGSKEVKPHYGGVEAWPGDHFTASECWCEFGDKIGYRQMYDINKIVPEITSQLDAWRSSCEE